MTIIGKFSFVLFTQCPNGVSFLTGVILCFRELIQDALSDQLEERIPFLTSSIQDFHEHASPHESSLVAEMACAAGYNSKVDPALLNTLRQQPKVGPHKMEDSIADNELKLCPVFRERPRMSI